jgi:hypothetical protein
MKPNAIDLGMIILSPGMKRPGRAKLIAISRRKLAYLLDQIVLDAHLFDLIKLRFDPINMIFFVFQD